MHYWETPTHKVILPEAENVKKHVYIRLLQSASSILLNKCSLSEIFTVAIYTIMNLFLC